MNNTFAVNKKKYTAKPFDLNMVCDLEDYGVSLAEMKSKSMSMVRAYFALCANLDKDDAGSEIQQHLLNGGKFNDIIDVMKKEMEESDFFRALSETAETKTTAEETQATTDSTQTTE